MPAPDPAALAASDVPAMHAPDLATIEASVVACERCPDLRAYCARIATEKKRAFRDETYWGRPVPAFGDPRARVMLVGLAPGAHGSNRTGRMFTGDASGVWLYRALFRAGFSNRSEPRDRDDGLVLHDVLITAALRCAPPGNAPTPEQRRHCFPYLVAEVDALEGLRVVVGLGAIGTNAALSALAACGYAFAARHVFAHLAETRATHATRPPVVLLSSYHPSRQNTNTGVLTEPMLDAVFTRARDMLDGA